jgi:23S rRNA (uracil1939-C5)-methyltransferase
VTYVEIKEYVLKEPNLYIAQVKTKCGIIEHENYNKSKIMQIKNIGLNVGI